MKMCPFELVAIPMPSPRYKLGGILKKFGTDSKGISGTFCALARVAIAAGERFCAKAGLASETAASTRVRQHLAMIVPVVYPNGAGPRNVSRIAFLQDNMWMAWP